MVLSDLEVHRIQAAGNARYFGKDDPVALADHLADAVNVWALTRARRFSRLRLSDYLTRIDAQSLCKLP
jgi:hypothetical protein